MSAPVDPRDDERCGACSVLGKRDCWHHRDQRESAPGFSTLVAARQLTEDEFYQMAHAIGHPQSRGCSTHGGRNHYCTSADDPLWLGLVDRGLATVRRSAILPINEATFHVTDPGREAIEVDPRSKPTAPNGETYTVRFKGYSHSINVRATTRGKARYAAALAVTEAWNVTAAAAFKLIESCRKGYL